MALCKNQRTQIPFLSVSLFALSLSSAFAYTQNTSSPPVSNQADIAKIKLDTNAKKSYHRISLPQKIYANLPMADLSGLRIKNAQGDYLPYAWQYDIGIREEKDMQSGIIFPISKLDNPSEKGVPLNWNIKVHKDGSLEATSASSTEANGTEATDDTYSQNPQKRKANFEALIIDISSHKKAQVNTLQFSFSEEGIFPYKLEASDDLLHWNEIVGKAQLVNLKHQDSSIEKNSLDLPYNNFKYLRLVWLDKNATTPIYSVNVGTQKQTRVSPDLEWSESIAPQSCDKESCVYLAPKNAPLDVLRIELNQGNVVEDVVVEGTLSSNFQYYSTHQSRNPLHALKVLRDYKQTNHPEQNWNHLHNAKIYKLPSHSDTEQWVQHDDFQHDGYVYEKIRIRAYNGALQTKPTIKVGSHIKHIVFLARGNAPYTLEWVKSSKVGQATNLNDLYPQLKPNEKPSWEKADLEIPELPRASNQSASNATASATTAASTATSAPVKSPVNKVWLWGGLALGLLALGAMVFSLFKSMDKEKN